MENQYNLITDSDSDSFIQSQTPLGYKKQNLQRFTIIK